MKRGRLVLVVGVFVGLVAMAEIGQEGRRAAPTIEQISPPTQEATSPPAPLLEERGESTLTSLEAEVAALGGVRELRMIVSVDGIVYMEIDVLEGYAAQPFAEALLEVARRYGPVEDFSVMLSDGVRVPISYLWRNGAWVGTEMIQQATLARATAQPTRAVDYSVPPTAPVVSPYTCNGLDDLNCSDFNRQWGQAQAHLQMCGDEDNLDGDGDGRACEY